MTKEQSDGAWPMWMTLVEAKPLAYYQLWKQNQFGLGIMCLRIFFYSQGKCYKMKVKTHQSHSCGCASRFTVRFLILCSRATTQGFNESRRGVLRVRTGHATLYIRPMVLLLPSRKQTLVKILYDAMAMLDTHVQIKKRPLKTTAISCWPLRVQVSTPHFPLVDFSVLSSQRLPQSFMNMTPFRVKFRQIFYIIYTFYILSVVDIDHFLAP